MLEQALTGPYYQPYPSDQLPGDGDWHKMPRSERPQSEVQHLITRVILSEEEGVLTLDFDIQGTSHVPLAIELAFRKGGVLKGVSTVPEIDNAFLLEEGEGTYVVDGDAITFGPGSAVHHWTQLRGAASKLDALSVYITGYTPFLRRLTIS